MISKPPSKELCLYMAKRYYDDPWVKHPAHKLISKDRSWEWLFCWGWYDHWVEEYFND